MEYDTKDFFVENEDKDVQGFVVIETDETEGYRIAEKWNRSEAQGGPVWITYWIPAGTLSARADRGECKKTTSVSDKQFRGVLNLAGVKKQVAA